MSEGSTLTPADIYGLHDSRVEAVDHHTIGERLIQKGQEGTVSAPDLHTKASVIWESRHTAPRQVYYDPAEFSENVTVIDRSRSRAARAEMAAQTASLRAEANAAAPVPQIFQQQSLRDRARAAQEQQQQQQQTNDRSNER